MIEREIQALCGDRCNVVRRESEAWIDAVSKKDGRIHGRVNQNAAVTGRMTHSGPNMAQVPKVQHCKKRGVLMGLEGGWGYECRQLFTVPKGKKLVGADASGLELRCLAHFMALHDGGAYQGNKQGTLMLSKYALGHGELRADGAIELSKAAP